MMSRQVLSRVAAAAAFVLLAAGACQEPTQVELRLSTDLPCDSVHGTAVTVGRRGELEHAFPAASLEICEAGPDGRQHLGLVVLVPRDGTSDDAIAVKVVAAVTARSVDECKPGEAGARGYQGCVVARRGLRYEPGQTLRIEVPLLGQCEGVECTTDSSCFDATTCLPAAATCREEACMVDSAPEHRFPNPAGPGSAAGGGAGVPWGSAGGGGQAWAGGKAGAGGMAGTGGAGGGLGGAAGVGGAGGEGGLGGPLGSQIAMGAAHSCAMIASSEVRCWGRNDYGQLGDGTQTNRLTPEPVRQVPGGPPLTGVQALTLGYEHSCTLLSGSEVRCWGFNGAGQLGDGTTEERRTPVSVRQSPGGPALTGVQSLILGGSHSCALLSEGDVRCWGFNISGQLGNDTTENQHTPVPVVQAPGGPPLTGVQTLALGMYHSCALLEGGQVRCWGYNGAGQLGDGTQTNRLTPTVVLQSSGGPPLTGVQALTLGESHSCALLNGGEVRCWGWNGYGQLGDGTTVDRLNPVPVRQSPGGPPLTGVQSLALSGVHSCASLSGGEVRCWGGNDAGQLGDGTTVDRLSPELVQQLPGEPPLTGVQALALGYEHSCALLSGGEVRCWGGNGAGQLGDGTTEDRLNPVPVQFLPGTVAPLLASPSAWSALLKPQPL